MMLMASDILVNIGSGNGLLPVPHQDITWQPVQNQGVTWPSVDS